MLCVCVHTCVCVCVSHGYLMFMINNEGKWAGCQQHDSRTEAAYGGHREGSEMNEEKRKRRRRKRGVVRDTSSKQ